MKHSNTWYALILIASALLLSAAGENGATTLKPPKTEQHESLTDKQTSEAQGYETNPGPTPSEQHPETSGLISKRTTQKEQDHADHPRPEATVAEWIMVGITSAYMIVAFFTLLAISRQADIAEEAITEIERPWIMVLPTSYDVQPSAGTVQTPRVITFSWTVKNVGRSPAWLTAGRGMFEKGLAKDLPEVPDYKEEFKYALTPHPPNEEGFEERATLHFTPTEYVALCEGRLDFNVRGCISYRGLGDRKHETRFCMALRRGPQGLAMSFCGPPAYNSYT